MKFIFEIGKERVIILLWKYVVQNARTLSSWWTRIRMVGSSHKSFFERVRRCCKPIDCFETLNALPHGPLTTFRFWIFT